MSSTSFFPRHRPSSLLDSLTRSYPLPFGDRLPFSLRVRPYFLLATFLLVSILAVLALAPIPELPVNDKALHFLGNGITSLLIYPIIDPPPNPSPWWQHHSPLLLTLLVSVLLMGVGSEFVQGALSSRTFDPFDIVANLSPLVLTIPFSIWFWRDRPGDSVGRELYGGRDVWDVRDEDEELLEEGEGLLAEAGRRRGSS